MKYFNHEFSKYRQTHRILYVLQQVANNKQSHNVISDYKLQLLSLNLQRKLSSFSLFQLASPHFFPPAPSQSSLLSPHSLFSCTPVPVFPFHLYPAFLPSLPFSISFPPSLFPSLSLLHPFFIQSSHLHPLFSFSLLPFTIYYCM